MQSRTHWVSWVPVSVRRPSGRHQARCREAASASATRLGRLFKKVPASGRPTLPPPPAAAGQKAGAPTVAPPVAPTIALATLLLLTLTTAATATTGPQTRPVDTTAFTQVLYVSPAGDDATATGTKDAPYATIAAALAAADTGRSAAILIAAGTYVTQNLQLKTSTSMFGGFDPTDWTRDIHAHPTILDAGGEDRVLVTSADDFSTRFFPSIDGFHIRNGKVHGPGGGILIDGTSPRITNNVFTQNSTLAPEGWAPKYLHETAHDGGAIYCRNSGRPTIRNNLIVANSTQIGRGAGIAFDHNCIGTIADNVIIGNTAGTADPMRSSDGGGISLFNWSSVTVRNNVVLGNQALNNNDGGGIFVAYWSSARVRDNVIVGNQGGDDGGGLFVGGQEHRYDRPLDPMPSAEEFFVEVSDNRFFGNTNPSRNSGALRITMESRGLVTRNVAALNGGFYLQRSELEVTDNTILEDTILIETKEGLEPIRFGNNIVTGAVEHDGTAVVSASLIRDGLIGGGEGNIAGVPELLEDASELQVVATSFSPSTHQTHVTVAAPLPAVDLTNRVVASRGGWGVVHSASGRNLTLWGNHRAVTELRMLPTYRQIADSPGFGKGFDAARAVSDYQPQRVNKSIELLERGQPIYYDASTGGYEEGVQMAGTWGDYIIYNVEHVALDFAALREFMRGLVDAGPTPSGHRTPTVIVSLPLLGLDEPTVTAGGWMVQQALAQGAHGVHLARARDPEGVKRFVQAARYPIHKQAVDVLGEGLRGWGSQTFAAWVWGLSVPEYLRKADVWPLNPEGEIMLGVKLEDQQALDRAAETLSVPGLAFAEHGPRDLGLSYGYLEGRADPPLPPEVVAAGDMVLELTKERGMFFLDNVLPGNVAAQIDRGVMIGAGRREDSAEVGREYSGRRMPW